MKKMQIGRLTKGLFYSAIVFAGYYFLLFSYVTFSRVNYPFELEWMEGGSLIQIRRILQGQLLYVPPSLEFVPFIYTPFYFYASAGLSFIIGEGFLPLRLVSLLSSLGCFVFLYLIVSKISGSQSAGFFSSGLFAGTYRFSGTWFDLARVDTLSLLLLLAGIYFLLINTQRSHLLAGAFLSLSYFTKQTNLIFIIPIIFYTLIANRKRLLAFGASNVIFIGLGSLFLDVIHKGWYKFYIFDLPAQHNVIPEFPVLLKESLLFWGPNILILFAPAIIISLSYIFAPILTRAYPQKYLLILFICLGMLCISWASKLNPGSARNVYMPGYASISILFGLGLGKRLKNNSSREGPAPEPKYINFVFLLCILQFAILLYRPHPHIPTKEDRYAGEQLVQMISSYQGDVYIPYHSYLSEVVGKRGYAHWITLQELSGGFGGESTDQWDRVYDELTNALQEQQFAAIILDEAWLLDVIEKDYDLNGDIFKKDDVFWPVSGWRIRPKYLYHPSSP